MSEAMPTSVTPIDDSKTPASPAYTRVVDSFEFSSSIDLSLTFDESTLIVEGSTLTPLAVSNEPHVLLTGASNDTLYTLILSDPDAPSVADPKFGEWQHWIVVNAPGGVTAKGDVMTEFFGSAPGKDSGVHRYCFVAYAQESKIKVDDEPHIPLASGFPPVSTCLYRRYTTQSIAFDHIKSPS